MGSLVDNLLVLHRTKGSSMATTGSDAFNWFEVPRPFLVPTLRALSLIRRVEAGMADTGGVTGQGSRALIDCSEPEVRRRGERERQLHPSKPTVRRLN